MVWLKLLLSCRLALVAMTIAENGLKELGAAAASRPELNVVPVYVLVPLSERFPLARVNGPLPVMFPEIPKAFKTENVAPPGLSTMLRAVEIDDAVVWRVPPLNAM